MPELPEVETIRIGLQTHVVGHTITGVDIRLAKIFTGDQENIRNGKIIDVRRFGKGLVIDLNNAYSIAIHVKMTGQLIYQNSKQKQMVNKHVLPSKHTHVIFYLDRGGLLFYNDQRQFGWIQVVPSDAIFMQPFFKALGPEPLKDLTLVTFEQIIAASRMPIKTLIMDQRKIAGIGNIYANDALYVAGIHPKRAASSLTAKEVKRLFEAIEQVLRSGLQAGGASEWHYVNVLGEKGDYQHFFKVYGKDGTACTICGNSIKRTKLGGRGTFYCQFCQR